jgi:hypothetical protein
MEDEGLVLLTNLLSDKDWFCGAEHEGNRYVVYVKHMNLETMTVVPDEVLGRQVVAHFISHKKASREQFTTNGTRVPFSKPAVIAPSESIEDLSSDLLESDIDLLIKELDRLERVCGSRTLQDIFYEVHDQQNAVTSYSAKYPDVRTTMQSLYDEYGFDVIYEELDG